MKKRRTDSLCGICVCKQKAALTHLHKRCLAALVREILLQLYGCTSSLQLGLDLLSVSLGSTFLQGLGSALNNFLCFLQAQTQDLLNSLISAL